MDITNARNISTFLFSIFILIFLVEFYTHGVFSSLFKTGMGMWQTVAVREVDEEAEIMESERVRELMYKGRAHQIDEVSV